jgi:hypothetical protein
VPVRMRVTVRPNTVPSGRSGPASPRDHMCRSAPDTFATMTRRAGFGESTGHNGPGRPCSLRPAEATGAGQFFAQMSAFHTLTCQC